jgi:predicted ATP-grasp superfamily ATP-dependent carboligase
VAPAPALVFGAGVTGLAVLRSMGRNGVPAYHAGADTALVRASRWYVPAPGGPVDEARVAGWLEQLPFERAVLIPASDDWALALARVPEGRFAPAVAPLDVVRTFVDKLRFSQAAARLGVPTPRTIFVRGVEDLDALAGEDLGSHFLKPVDSQAFAARYGTKGFWLEDRARAADTVRRLAEEGLEMLLQEFIPGPPTGHVFLDGYVDRTGVMRAVLARQRLRLYPPKLGNTSLAVTIRLDEAAAALESLRRLFAGTGYAGIFNAEFVHDERDGVFKLLEVNARPYWQLELATAAGLDLAQMAYRDALGEAVETAPGYRVGVRWVHPLNDFRARGLDVRALLGPGNAVWARDDPRPVFDGIARQARRLARLR